MKHQLLSGIGLHTSDCTVILVGRLLRYGIRFSFSPDSADRAEHTETNTKQHHKHSLLDPYPRQQVL